MRLVMTRKGMLFVVLTLMILAIAILAIVWISKGSPAADTNGNGVDSLAFDSTTLYHEETTAYPSDSDYMANDVKTAASLPLAAQSWLEKLVTGDMHKSLYGISASAYDIEVGEIESGQTFSKLMNDKYDVNIAVINKLIEKSKGIFDMRDLRAGKQFTAFLSQDTTSAGCLQYLVYEKSPSEYVVFSAGDSIYVRKDRKDIVSQERYAECVINSSLWGAIYENGLNPQLAARLSEIYKYTFDFFAIQKGDKFRVIYEEQFIDTLSVGIGRIFGAEFTHNGKPYMAVRFEQRAKNGEIEVGYWDAQGKNLRKSFLSAPLSFSARVSSKFGMRIHPISRVRRQHNGIDYAAPTGTPVLAVADGTVTAKGWDRGGGGNRIWLRHSQGLESAYLHLSRFAKGVAVGGRVRQGQVIGYVGSTGGSTGPHLDFRIRQKGRYIDPAKTPSTPTDPISASNKGAFDKMRNDVQTAMNQYAKK